MQRARVVLEDNPMWIYSLPNGFRALGHTVATVGIDHASSIPAAIQQFKPDLIFYNRLDPIELTI